MKIGYSIDYYNSHTETRDGESYDSYKEARNDFDYDKAWLNKKWNGAYVINADVISLYKDVYDDNDEIVESELIERVKR